MTTLNLGGDSDILDFGDDDADDDNGGGGGGVDAVVDIDDEVEDVLLLKDARLVREEYGEMVDNK